MLLIIKDTGTTCVKPMLTEIIKWTHQLMTCTTRQIILYTYASNCTDYIVLLFDLVTVEY